MDKNSWSKTMLEVYRYLPRVTYAYDKIIKTKAINSQFSNYYDSFNNVFDVTNSIIELSEKKVALINLKLIIEKVLKQMKKDQAKLLILRFIDGKKYVEINKIFNMSLRTAFRRMSRALSSFTQNLNALGYTSKKIYDMLKSESWIMEVFNSYDSQVEVNIADYCDMSRQIKSNIIIEFKKASSF